MMKKLLTIACLLLIMTPLTTPRRALAQSTNCDTKQNKFTNFDLPGTPSPTVTPTPFNPDLGYSKIKDCLPVSRFDSSSWEDIIARVLQTLSYIVAFLAIFGLIISGIMYITAGGDQDKAEKARHNIVWVVIGILIYMFALYFLPLIRSGVVQIFGGG